ncbi:PiggyBac transposable element-derived protein, partial [Trinorchestia longiramus]
LHWSEYAMNDKISSTMSRKRWEDIKASLHLVDNSKLDPSNKLAKVRLLVDHLREKFQKLPMEEHLSVDEQIVPFKGTSSMKQYIPKKPHKWGYKIFVLAGSSGLVYDFIPYTGKIAQVDRPGVPDLGASGNSVLHLAECIPDGNHSKLFFDN